MDGPRGLRPEELESARALTDLVMRVGLVDQYPQLFHPENLENARVCVADGKCVTHVGMTLQGAAFYGCLTRVACIGGVCTHPEYRKQGLASACFDDAMRLAEAAGADLMQVSGDRKLYRMRGCVPVGNDRIFTITPDALSPDPACDADITVELMQDAELPEVMECYRGEPVRFLRTPDDYHRALNGAWVMNRPSEFLVVRERGAFRGYVIAPLPASDGSARLAEFAGDRHALLLALPLILQRHSLTSLSFQVMGHDRLFRSLLEQAGQTGVPHSTPGTVTLLNFPRLMERLRPRFEELVGAATAARLRFAQEGTRCTFAYIGEEFTTERDEAARMLFSTPEGPSPALTELGGTLGETLRAILPLPTLWYGINYV